MTHGSVSINISDCQAIIQINRPPVNALDTTMWQTLQEVALSLHDEPNVTSVIITGGAKCFSAGGDLQEINSMTPQNVNGYRGALQQAAVSALAAIPQPVVAAIEGYAVGGGFEICLAADFRVCGIDSFIGLPEVKLGMLPAAGGTQRLVRLVGTQNARRMLYSGKNVSATEALAIGAIDEVVPNGTAVERAQAWAQDLAQHHPAISRIKQALTEGPEMALPQALQLESRLWALSLSDPLTQALLKEFTESK